MWICLVIMLGLTALAARLTRRDDPPQESVRPVRQRPAMPTCVVIRSHHVPAARREAERRPGRRVNSAAPGR